ncbi:iron-sulfur cluster assembly scaffold protein [Candidatus Parcubacteria bacterium 4484_255]|nr:MAG: iron-sulfur cluster assembly scaffold protein [Candidatus Parcubacteria bacterium 4484_255]
MPGCFKDNSKIIEHFFHPRNMGVIKNPDAIGKIGNPMCGDVMHIYLKIKDNIIEDIKFKTYGCAVAIASTSILTELVKGKSLKEAKKISGKRIREMLGDMPVHKYHCTILAEQALKSAIENYEEK